MSASILSTLNLSATTKKAEASDRSAVLRRRFLTQIDHQIAAFESEQRGEAYFVVSEKWEKAGETGEKVRVQVKKRVKPWWYRNGTDVVMLEIRSGHRRIDLAPGKASIVVGTIDAVRPTLETIRKAAMAFEFDGVLAAMSEGRKRGGRVKKDGRPVGDGSGAAALAAAGVATVPPTVAKPAAKGGK